MRKQQLNILISIVAVCSFLFLITNALDSQGLYMDELHQATASFAYVGQIPFQFASLTFHNIPIMNMNYSGAIKTAIYSLYMRIFDQTFSVISWRMVGILFVAVALLLFGLIVGNTISPLGLVSIYFLIITDITVLLSIRHDWGPAALAFSLRLIILAIWMRGELRNESKPRDAFLLLFLFGVSLFEKLSAIVLIIPLALMIFLNPVRRNKPHLFAAFLGGIMGGIPIILANILSYFKNGDFISLQVNNIHKTYSISSLFSYIQEYLSLGAGKGVQSIILGTNADILSQLELILVPSLILMIIFLMYQNRLVRPQFRIIGILFLSYIIIMITTYFLPQNTWVHHWIIGTPFQYAAIAIFLSGLAENKIVINNKVYKNLVIAVFIVFALPRAIGLFRVENSLLQGDTSPAWSKSLTQIGEFAASKSSTAIFVAGDWGIANQIICFANGMPGLVLQPELDYMDAEDVINAVTSSNKPELYVVFINPPYLISLERRQALLDGLKQSLVPEWQLQPVEQQVADLSPLEIIKYQKTSVKP
jgi:hypothetical protein